MRRVALAAVFLTACAATTRTLQAPASVPAEFHVREEAVDDESGPAVTDQERAECDAAWGRFQTALEAALSGPCKSDDDCESFETCHAVTRPSAARLWKLKGEAQDSCRGTASRTASLTCGPGAATCQQGRCTR